MVRPKDSNQLNGQQLFMYGIYATEFCATLLAIITGSNLLIHIPSSCVGFRFLGITLIGIGVTFLILIGITCKVQLGKTGIMMQGKFCSMPLVLALTALGIFALSVSSQGGGKLVPGRSYKEYHVESYSTWMQHKLNANWDNYYKKAVVENKWYVCRKKAFDKDYSAPEPAFQSGCCEPPKDCNFIHTSSHVWAKLENNNSSKDDCNRWDNDPNTLCFNCQSCKAGFLEEVTSQWFSAGLLLTFFGGCLALIPAIFAMLGSIRSSSSSQDYRALA